MGLRDLKGLEIGKHCREALFWTVLVLLFSSLPLIGAAFLAKAFGKWTGWLVYFSNGELCIYSASLMGGTLYVLITVIKNRVLITTTFIVLLADILVFAVFAVRNLFEDYVDVRVSFLIAVSVGALTISIVVALVTKVLENLWPSWRQYRDMSGKKLNDQFDNV